MSWFMPTRIISGPGAVISAVEAVRSLLIVPPAENRAAISAAGGRDSRPAPMIAAAPGAGSLPPVALVVTGRHSGRASGALDDALALLKTAGIDAVVFSEVEPNPGPATIRAGAERAREAGACLVVGIGGGSPLDAAKAIALFAANHIPEDETFCPHAGRDALPLIAIPTTAGTGSEVTPYAILTNEGAKTKTSISHPSMFPRLALLDGRYTASLSRASTINTALDAFSHALEGCLTKRRTPFSRALAHSTLALIAGRLRALASGEVPSDAARQELLEEAAMAGMVIAQSGTTVGHALGYCLTVDRGLDHGRANALVLPALLETLHQRIPQEVDALLEAAGFGARVAGARATAAGARATAAGARATAAGARATAELRNLFDALLGAREEADDAEIADWARRAAGSKNLANMICSPSRDDLEDILRSSLAPAQAGRRIKAGP